MMACLWRTSTSSRLASARSCSAPSSSTDCCSDTMENKFAKGLRAQLLAHLRIACHGRAALSDDVDDAFGAYALPRQP